ncbi:4HBT domain-containing protein [Mycena chlorophos]|uniref:4HBT domain-containing protein n=1 Tax=Mycena chlorophos TaxID=658473 RepID=A0A8H6TN97_MYCCL|nr:4HBT domain-containing protein [Mycena chlorophos]
MAIAGNAPTSMKELFSDLPAFMGQRRGGKPAFGHDIIAQMKVTHASVDPKAEEPSKKEGRVVVELPVIPSMLNGGGNVHGGCAAFLIDLCSTLSLLLLDPSLTVSQSLNVVYHSPATLGETLRIVNTTLTVGSRALSARTEIWNATKHRLVASGVHIKMQPSPAKL